MKPFKEPMVAWESASASECNSRESDIRYILAALGGILDESPFTAKYRKALSQIQGETERYEEDDQELYDMAQEIEGLLADKGFLTLREAGDWALYAPLEWALHRPEMYLLPDPRDVYEREALLES